MNDADKPIDWEEELIADNTVDALHRELREAKLNNPLAIRVINRFYRGAMLLYEEC